LQKHNYDELMLQIRINVDKLFKCSGVQTLNEGVLPALPGTQKSRHYQQTKYDRIHLRQGLG
jgi:hypothetical protein